MDKRKSALTPALSPRLIITHIFLDLWRVSQSAINWCCHSYSDEWLRFLTPTYNMATTLPRRVGREHCASAPFRFKSGSTQPAEWATHEFGQAIMPDRRHHRRLCMIATAFAEKPTAPIPQACPNAAEAKAAYRFMENEAIAPAALRQAHHQATLERVRAHRLVLAVQDTTALNYSTHPQTAGLGPLGSHSPKTIGLFLHSTLALTATGQPLGLLHNAVRVRRQSRGLRASRHKRKLAQKESYKWVESLQACQALAPQCPQTRLVNVADREGDLYALFAQALRVPDSSRVHLLVRARHDRPLADRAGTLWAEVGRQRVAAKLSVLVGRKADQPSRVARLNLRFCAVQLQASGGAGQPPLQVWAIEAREVSAPGGATPIVWRLLTTLPVTNAKEAAEKVGWYAQRWQIEVLHKVLKSGCQIEQRQLETAERLERVLAIDLVVAWRILALCKAARELPNDPISDWLPTAQWQALCCYVYQRTRPPPRKPPGVRLAVRWIAQLGGFLARKSDGEPGTKTLWRGLQQLEAMTNMWRLFQDQERSPKCG